MAELIINGKSYKLNFKFKNFIDYRNLFNADFFTDIEYLFQKNLNFIRELPSEIQDKFLNQKELNNVQFNDLIKIKNSNSFDLSDYVKISQLLYVLIDSDKKYEDWFDALDFLPNREILISIYTLFQESQKNTIEIKKN